MDKSFDFALAWALTDHGHRTMNMLQLSKSTAYYGPNPYAMEPIVLARLQIEEAAAAQCRGIITEFERIFSDWFVADRAVDDLPPVQALTAFLLNWSLSALNWVKGAITVSGHRPMGRDSSLIWIGFHAAAVSDLALRAAVHLANAAIAGRADEEFNQLLSDLWRRCRSYHPDSSDELIIQSARASDVPFSPAWDLPHHWQFGWGARAEVFCSASSNRVGTIFGRVANNKAASKRLIQSLGFPAPRHVLVGNTQDIASAVSDIGFPCVVKPADLRGGQGVRADLRNIDDVIAAYDAAHRLSDKPIMIEAFVAGFDHRLMVIDGRFVGAFRREPPLVVGDGKCTIAELVDRMNRGRAPTGAFNAHRATKVLLDDSVLSYLAVQNLSPEAVPSAGQKVVLRSNANLSTGGSCRDVTADVHPDIIAMSEALACACQTRIVGLDYMTTDIGRSWRESLGALIELNTMPALGIPTLGGRSPAEIGKLALGDQPGRIPLHVLLVTDEHLLDACRRVDPMMERTSGWATHNQASIGSLALQVNPSHPWSGVRTLLAHRTVERAVLVVPTGHLQRHGLPVDRADRIWDLSSGIAPQWHPVLQDASRAPLAAGDWEEFAAAWCALTPVEKP